MVAIARLPGHALETTERHVHLSDRSVSDAAERVSVRTGAALAGSGDSPMPTVDLTPRRAGTAGPVQGHLFLFDRGLPSFCLRIHPSVSKVWIVQVRIEGRTRRIVITRLRKMPLAEARAPPAGPGPAPCGPTGCWKSCAP